MVGVNRISHDDYLAMSKSKYFNYYFEDTIAELPAKVAEKCEPNLEWDSKLSPFEMDKNSSSTGYEILELPVAKFKKTLKDIYDLAFLKELLGNAKKGEYKILIEKQIENVQPSADEIKSGDEE